MAGYAPLPGFLLEPGDLLIKAAYERDPVSHAIRAGQAIVQGSQYANYVHAAIALNADYIVEAQGAGVVKNKLKDNLRHGYRYKVFRYKDPQIAKHAADWAASQLERETEYSISKAFKSLFKKKKPKSEDDVALLGESNLFCSELTVECYNRASPHHNTLLIPIKPDEANPSTLYHYLKHCPEDWENLGDLP